MTSRRTLSAALLAAALSWSAELYDRVEAVVGSEPILRSELMEAAGQFRSQPGYGQLNDLELRKKVLSAMIDEKVLLARAEIDSVTIDPKEIDQRVDDHIQRIARRQRMTIDQLAQAVRRQMGIDVSVFRERLRKRFREEALLQKMRAKYIGEVKLTPKEVERFYAENRADLPPQRQCVRISHVQVKILPKMEELERARNGAVAALAELDKGADFAQLAAKLSADASTASSGGDLGFVRRGELDPKFEYVAFGLEPGEWSRAPLYTRAGYHVVKLLDRRDNEIRPAHILFGVVPGPEDTLAFRRVADSLKAAASDSAAFAKIASERSDDEQTRAKGGDLGWFQRADLNIDYAPIVETLKPGEVSDPVLIDDSWHLFRLSAQSELRELNLSDDWATVEEYALDRRTQEKMRTFVEKWRREVPIEIRDPELRR